MIRLKIAVFFTVFSIAMPLRAINFLKCPILSVKNMCENIVTGQDPKMKIAQKSKPLLEDYCREYHRSPQAQGFFKSRFIGSVIGEYGECSYTIPSQWWMGTLRKEPPNGKFTLIHLFPKVGISIGQLEFSHPRLAYKLECPRLSYRAFMALIEGYIVEKDGYIWKERGKKQTPRIGRLKSLSNTSTGQRGAINAKQIQIHHMCSYDLKSNAEDPSNPIVLKNIVMDETLTPPSPLESASPRASTEKSDEHVSLPLSKRRRVEA